MLPTVLFSVPSHLTAKTRPNKQWAVKRALTERVVSDLRATAPEPVAA